MWEPPRDRWNEADDRGRCDAGDGHRHGLFTNVNPATLFIGGAVCTFLGVINVISRPEAGPAVSAGDAREAQSLANLQRYGSVDGSARFID